MSIRISLRRQGLTFGISFLTDYFHTAIILIIACYISIKAFTFEEIGSIGNLYDLVKAAAQRHPVSGNHDGTYLTMTSKGVGLNSQYVGYDG